MSTKIRVQVGDTVICWGIAPESIVRDHVRARQLLRPRFAVIEGGVQSAPIVQDDLPMRARSA